MNTDAVIRKVQALVNVTVDGRAGSETWRAIYETVAGKNLPNTATFAGKASAEFCCQCAQALCVVAS